jgi:hypothetical protein
VHTDCNIYHILGVEHDCNIKHDNGNRAAGEKVTSEESSLKGTK